MPVTSAGVEGARSFLGLGQACRSQGKGERPGHLPLCGEEAEVIWLLREWLAPRAGRAHGNPRQSYWSLFGDFGGI